MKKCNQCKKYKELLYFGKEKRCKKGITSICKDCINYNGKLYRQTKIGLISQIYNAQKQSSKRRGHNPPDYTQNELREFIYKDKNFETLYNNWKNSGFKKDLRPSIDRKNDYIGYTLTNIQLMTCYENITKGMNDIRNGINNKGKTPIIQIDIISLKEKFYISTIEAQKITGINASSIIAVCQGKRKTAGGYKWKFNNKYLWYEEQK